MQLLHVWDYTSLAYWTPFFGRLDPATGSSVSDADALGLLDTDSPPELGMHLPEPCSGLRVNDGRRVSYQCSDQAMQATVWSCQLESGGPSKDPLGSLCTLACWLVSSVGALAMLCSRYLFAVLSFE